MCGRNIDRLPLLHPQLGTWPTIQACALTGNQTDNLWLCRTTVTSLSHASQGHLQSFRHPLLLKAPIEFPPPYLSTVPCAFLSQRNTS